MIIKCKECGNMMSSESHSICRRCGYAVPDKARALAVWIILAFVCLTISAWYFIPKT